VRRKHRPLILAGLGILVVAAIAVAIHLATRGRIKEHGATLVRQKP